MKNSEQLYKNIENCFNYIYLRDVEQGFDSKSLLGVLKDCGDEKYIHKYPYAIFWKVTSECNLRCKHCYYYESQEKFASDDNFSIDELLSLAEFFVEELNAVIFTITGGEPFLQKDIFKLLKYLKSKNVPLIIQTNATLITEKTAKELSKILNPKFDSMQVSLDGASSSVHDSTRGRGAFKKSIAGIRHLTQNKINVTISYTVTSENLAEIPALYDLGKELKIKSFYFNKFKACSENQVYLLPNVDEVFTYTSELIEKMRDDKSISLNFSNLKVWDFFNHDIGKKLLGEYMNSNDIPVPQNLMCHCKHESVTVSANGSLYLCSQAEKDELCLGNLREKTFFEIWGKRFDNVFYQERCLDKSVCKKCEYIPICKAGCPANAYEKYNDINAPDGDCCYGKILLDDLNGEKKCCMKI